jgi:hypothetical protein
LLAGTSFVVEKKLAALADTFQVNDESGSLLAAVTRDGLNFVFVEANGARMGEIRGARTDRTLPDYDELYEFQVLNEQGQLIGAVKAKAYRHQRTGFLKNAAWNFDHSWCVEGPGGEDLARIKPLGGVAFPSVQASSIETPSGTVIAEVQRKALSIHQNCTLHILDPIMDPYLVLASLFAHPTKRETGGRPRGASVETYQL